MSVVLSSRQLNQDTNAAKRAAKDGPVIITDRGRPAFVLLTYDAYQNLKGPRQSIAAALAMPADVDLDVEIPRVPYTMRDIDLS